jgi:tripartite-type tricarboxylate transporter receptor subunit TctC
MKKAVALLLLVFATGAAAQSWPSRPVRLVVPFGAGGNTDLCTRITAERLSAVFGRQFLVENRLGASGTIAAEHVLKSEPDGYTFFIGSTVQISVLPLFAKLNFDPRRDFIPVAIVASNPFVLGIHASIPAKNLREFTEYVKARPGKFSYGSGGTGTIGHLSGALFLARAGLDMVHVPYKSGPQGVGDLAGGQLQMYFGTPTDIIPHARAGKITIIGVSSEKRLREIPDVPAIAETYPGFNLYSWNGLLAPAGTPRDIVERLAREVTRIGIALDEFAELVRREHPLWVEVVKTAGIKPE